MEKIFTSYKKANLKYARVNCFEAGIQLQGFEVKSVKAGRASLDGSYVVVRGNEAFLVGASIPPWQLKNAPKSYELDRSRKLLLHKDQLLELATLEGKKGVAIIAFSLYNKKGLIKVEVCTTKNKNNRDRREDIKKRDSERDLRRDLKSF